MRLLGQKWSLPILHELLSGTRRFNDLLAQLPGLNSKTLSQRLRAFEQRGLVRREVLATIPAWVEYTLTPCGSELEPVFACLRQWAECWIASAQTLGGALVNELDGDRGGVAQPARSGRLEMAPVDE